MATHDYVIANGTGAAVRSDLNDALAAIVSNNSSSSEPATTYAYQWWADTNANVLKIRNSANNAWITLRELDGTMLIEDGSASTPGLAFADDVNTGIFSPAADQIGFATGGVERLEIGSSEVVFNDPSNDVDFRVESNGNTHMLFVDAGNDRVGINSTAPTAKLHIVPSGSTAYDAIHVGDGLFIGNTSNNASAAVFHQGGGADLEIGAQDVITFTTGDVAGSASERMRINSSGQVGVGTSSPSRDLHVNNSSDGSFLLLTSQVNQDGLLIGARNDGNGSMVSAKGTDSHLRLFTTDSGGTESERVRIDSSGNVAIGTTSPDERLHVKGGNDQVPVRFENTSSASCMVGFKTSGATNTFNVRCGCVGNDSFGIFTDNSERARIDSTGNLLVGKSELNDTTEGLSVRVGGVKAFEATVASGASHCMMLNRQGDDGTLVLFRQANTNEGSISVSGSTVSYNGGHLARWSQLADGAERTAILRGSVLSNLDEMCEWAHAAQEAVLYTEEDELPEGVSVGDVKTPAVSAFTEDNEQLNRMKVSDVEGDPNVAGVFQAWDDNDDTYTNDFYCAMTGDFVIRIAQGTTVARGDLLMSAGDGTAKPQDDDIVRSKTIAKVTSTTVSTTYSDGSYCVPCVLMAC